MILNNIYLYQKLFIIKPFGFKYNSDFKVDKNKAKLYFLLIFFF